MKFGSGTGSVKRLLRVFSLCVMENATSEEIKVGSAVSHPFEELDSRNCAFDSAAAPGQGEAVEDGVVVTFDAGDDRVQRGSVVVLDAAHPVLEPATTQFPH